MSAWKLECELQSKQNRIKAIVAKKALKESIENPISHPPLYIIALTTQWLIQNDGLIQNDRREEEVNKACLCCADR